MKCVKCGADSAPDLTGSVCPKCLEAEKAGHSLFLKIVVSLFIVAMFVSVVAFLSTQPKANSDRTSNAAPEAASNEQGSVSGTALPQAAVVAPPEPAKPRWDYSTINMDAGSKVVKVGCIQSDEMVALNSPYSSVYASLCFRTDGAVLFVLDGDGQLLSGDNHGAKIRIANGPARSYSLVEPADYSSNRAFVEPEGPLFAAAKVGKTITIDATYYEAGDQTVSFAPSQPLSLK